MIVWKRPREINFSKFSVKLASVFTSRTGESKNFQNLPLRPSFLFEEIDNITGKSIFIY